jgi:hypothetical protein
MSPYWLALFEPHVLKQPFGHNKVPMIFWGPTVGPGVERKTRMVAPLRDNEGLFTAQPSILISYPALNLMGAW